MNKIFALNATSGQQVNTGLILRKLEAIPASGATVLFTSTLNEQKPESPPSPFLLSLVQFFHTLRVKQIPYTKCPDVNPWAAPRTLKVPELPQPAFHTPALPRAFYPNITACSDTEPYPLIPEVREEEPEVLQSGLKIPLEGVLKQDLFGMVYMEVSADQSDLLVPDEVPERAPSRIPVILPKETLEKAGWGGVQELGETFPVTVTGLYSLQPALWPEVERVWFCTLHAPILGYLREHYMHAGRRQFHLTLGTKKRKQPQKSSDGLYRLNVSCFAA